MLEDAEAGAVVAPLVAHLNDVSIAGPPAAGAATFRVLLDGQKGHPSIGLHLNCGKCGVRGGDAEEVAAVAKELGIKHIRQGVMAVGTLLGASAFVDTKLKQKAEEVQSLV